MGHSSTNQASYFTVGGCTTTKYNQCEGLSIYVIDISFFLKVHVSTRTVPTRNVVLMFDIIVITVVRKVMYSLFSCLVGAA